MMSTPAATMTPIMEATTVDIYTPPISTSPLTTGWVSPGIILSTTTDFTTTFMATIIPGTGAMGSVGIPGRVNR